ncbi:phage major capsid protein [Clostridium gasigenes]|uniref:phage major capsid protein n=1 Tax=Clostridium gasigenes TaxID=94869 RepID=UPI001C0D96C6|nr:phage major capsid protein [Clostridium gasigenes]MBU3135061.1 phage major capsid protein [Clostridium gasigenes]
MLRSKELEAKLVEVKNVAKDLTVATEINSKVTEIEDIKAQILIAKMEEEDEREEVTNKVEVINKKEGNDMKAIYNGELFYKNLTNKAALTSEEKLVITKVQNKLSEGIAKDGGAVVPDDITKEIIESIKMDESVRNLVRIENATSKTGTRLVKTGTPNKLFNTGEREQIKEMNNMEYGTIKYHQNKFTGKMDVPNELLDDSFVDFKQEIVSWLADSARYTENDQVFYGNGDDVNAQGLISTKGKFKEIIAPASITEAFLRKTKNSLKAGYRKQAKWVMNTEAQEVLCNLKNSISGLSLLTQDPRNEDQFTLFGRPVEIYDTVATDETDPLKKKTVIMYGVFDRAYRMFPRKNFEIKMTDIGAGAIETDTVVAIGIERFDGKIMDTEAMVLVRDFIV